MESKKNFKGINRNNDNGKYKKINYKDFSFNELTHALDEAIELMEVQHQNATESRRRDEEYSRRFCEKQYKNYRKGKYKHDGNN